FADFDPATLSGNPRLNGTVGGQFDLDATIDDVGAGVSLENVSGTTQLALARSTVGGLAIDRASLDADYKEQVADVRQLEVVGPDATLTAHGTLALGDTGNSTLTFHADSPRLADIGALFEVPLAGMGSVDGTLTGNRKELQAAGTLTADDVAYQDDSALTLTSSYTAKVSDFDFKHPVVEADSKATFVTIGGQKIDEVGGNA